MNDALSQLLQQSVTGDAKSSDELLARFQQHTFTEGEAEEINFYLKKVSHQYVDAIYLRGLLHEHGFGVDQDQDMAHLLMREAASKGNANAIYEVGRHYLLGIGVPQHYESALQWLKLAAESPHYRKNAMYELGNMYEQGLGVEQDAHTAKKWYERAAQKGHYEAEARLNELND